MNKPLYEALRKKMEEKFGKDYLRDIHTGESIDMTDEINEVAKSIASAMPEKRKLILEQSAFDRWNNNMTASWNARGDQFIKNLVRISNDSNDSSGLVGELE